MMGFFSAKRSSEDDSFHAARNAPGRAHSAFVDTKNDKRFNKPRRTRSSEIKVDVSSSDGVEQRRKPNGRLDVENGPFVWDTNCPSTEASSSHGHDSNENLPRECSLYAGNENSSKHRRKKASSKTGEGGSRKDKHRSVKSDFSMASLVEDDDNTSVVSSISTSYKTTQQKQKPKHKSTKPKRSHSRGSSRTRSMNDLDGNPTPMSPALRIVRRLSFSRRNSGKGSVPVISLAPKKRVHFCLDDKNRVKTTVIELPELSARDLRNIHWSRKEIKEMLNRAKALAEQVVYQKDERADNKILTCLHFCYGFADPDPLRSKLASIAAPGASTHQGYRGLSSPQTALHYYFHFQATESDGTDTNLRGLERHLSFAIVDYQMQCIQTVLTAQSHFRESEETWTPKQIESSLYKKSSNASLASRRFARLLGKGDAAIAGNKNARSDSKAQSNADSSDTASL